MIHFGCPSCGKSYQVKNEFAGKATKCADCGEVIRVPSDATGHPTGDKHREGPVKREEGSRWSVGNVAAVVVIVLLFGFMAWVALATLGVEGLTVLPVAVAAGLLSFVPAYWGSYLGRRRAVGQSGGFLLGLFLGWLGFFVVISFPDRGLMKKCRHCAEWVKQQAKVCKHCRRDL